MQIRHTLCFITVAFVGLVGVRPQLVRAGDEGCSGGHAVTCCATAHCRHGAACHCRQPYHPPRHHHFCMEPPRGIILPSMPAARVPMMLPTPVGLAPLTHQAVVPAGLQTPLRAPENSLEPDALRQLADALDARRKAAAPVCNDSGKLQAPTPPPDTTDMDSVNRRMDTLESRLGKIEAATGKLLERVEQVLRQND